MFDRTPHRHEPRRTADRVLWRRVVAGPLGVSPYADTASEPTILENKDGAFQTTLRYRGKDVGMLNQLAWATYLEGWNRIIRRLGSGWSMLADEWHEPSTSYPPVGDRNATGRFLDNIRRTIYKQGNYFDTDHFLTLTWQPQQARSRKWFDTLFVRHATERAHSEDARHLALFQGGLQRCGDALSGLLPLAKWASPSGTATYLHRCVSWDRHRITLPERPEFLDRGLATTRFTHGNMPQLGRRLLSPISIFHWPEGIGMTIPLALQHLGFPYRFTVRDLCLDKVKARKMLDGMRRRWTVQVLPLWVHVADAWNGTRTDWRDELAPVNEEAREIVYGLKRALASLAAGDVSYGFMTPTVLVWSDTEIDPDDPQTRAQARAEVLAKQREVVRVLQDFEMVVEPETVNATRAWDGMTPGNTYDNVRQPPGSSRATGMLLPHGAVWSGPTWDQQFQGPPIMLTGSNGQVFRLVLHQGEVGNWMIKGPTRSGKTGLMSILGMQGLERYGQCQIYAFDEKYNLYCPTLMAGGAHYDLGRDGKAGFQPLGQLDRSEGEQLWAQEWIQHVLTTEGRPPTHDERQEIWYALQRMLPHPSHERTLSTFVSYLQVDELKDVLRPFLRGGRYGFLDASEDSFRLGACWTTFELGDLLSYPAVLPHVINYITHRMEATFDGRPTILLFDECWKYFNHPVFIPKLQLYLKGMAKLNVNVVMATQEVVDTRESTLWQAIMGSVRTWIFLPNARAMHEDVWPHYRACGLTEGEADLLTHASNYQDYLYKSDEGVRLFQLKLTPLERLLCAASTAEEIAALKALVACSPGEPLPVAWLRDRGEPDAADLYLDMLEERQAA